MNTLDLKQAAVLELRPEGGFNLNGKGEVTFNTDGLNEPTEAEIKIVMDRMKAEYDAQEYARKRQAEYPSIQELVVALYDTDDKSAVEAKRAAVKLKYPKPE